MTILTFMIHVYAYRILVPRVFSLVLQAKEMHRLMKQEAGLELLSISISLCISYCKCYKLLTMRIHL